MIRKVERLRSKVEGRSPVGRQYKNAVKAKVEIFHSRAEKDIFSGIPELVCGRTHEAPGIEPLIEIRVGKSTVAYAIRPGGRACVGVVKREIHSKREPALCRVDRGQLPGTREMASPTMSQKTMSGPKGKIPDSACYKAQQNTVIPKAPLRPQIIGVLDCVGGSGADVDSD